jgi:parvulin-like peptidyl-prolyl isomerase
MRPLKAVLLAPLALCLVTDARAREVLDRIAAVVNDEVILVSDVKREAKRGPEMQEAMSALPANATADQRERARAQAHVKVLDGLIDDLLLRAEAERFQVTATDDDVDRALVGVAQGYGMKVEELKAEVEAGDEWESWDEYREELRRQILAYRATHILSTWSVSDAQVREHYRKKTRDETARVDVERFVFTPRSQDSKARDQAFVRAQKVARRLRAGEASEKIAAELKYDLDLEHSIGRGQIAPALEDALFAAKKNQIVGPLASGQGYVVFKVTEHHASSALSYEEAKERIRAQLEQEAFVQASQQFKGQLRARAHIDIRL